LSKKKATPKHGRRKEGRGGSWLALDFELCCFLVHILVEKCFSHSFKELAAAEVEEWDIESRASDEPSSLWSLVRDAAARKRVLSNPTKPRCLDEAG